MKTIFSIKTIKRQLDEVVKEFRFIKFRYMKGYNQSEKKNSNNKENKTKYHSMIISVIFL